MGTQWGPSSHSSPSPLSAHAYCGQTVAHLSNCGALVIVAYAEITSMESDYQRFFVTVCAGTAYQHLFSKINTTNYYDTKENKIHHKIEKYKTNKKYGTARAKFNITFIMARYMIIPALRLYVPSRSTQPCIPLGSLNRVPASAGVKAGMSTLPGGR